MLYTNSGIAKSIVLITSIAMIMVSIIAAVKRLNFLKIHKDGVETNNGLRRKFVHWENISHFGIWRQTLFGLTIGEFVGYDLNSGKRNSITKTKTGYQFLLPGKYGIDVADLKRKLEMMKSRNANIPGSVSKKLF